MTTMFIQLRRVVFPLALLLCWLCTVHAQETKGADQGVTGGGAVVEINREKAMRAFWGIPNRTRDEIKDDESLKNVYEGFWMAAWNVIMAVNGSDVLFANGTTCAAEWEKVIAANKKMVEDAAEDTKKITKLIKDVDAIMKEDWVKGDGKEKEKILRLKITTRDDEFWKLVGEIREVLRETKGKVPDAVALSKIEEAEQTRLFCTIVDRNVKYRLQELDKHLEALNFTSGGEFVKSRTAVEVKNAGDGVREVLHNVTNIIANATVHNRFAVGEAKDRVKAWRRAFELIELVGGMKDVEPVVGGKQGELEAIKGEVEERRQTIERLVNGSVDETKARGEKAVKEVNDRIEKASAVEVRRVEADVERVAEDERRKAEERKRAEEERKREAEQEKIRLAKEQEKIRRAKEEREREARNREQKAREEEERRALDEKARKAVEEEKAKRMAEEKAKKAKSKDGSSSPALVHSSLLLILLCVLGCALVC
ncbi:uncharacterized protein TM35_000651150 [Trypanosoma theileri]|uniref:Uncharacterized protein n=1 Tax=Trypanosoma theileri TaxID=67003 RepID=A0A1X0NGH5_9TRYP|nr:uncharacterized protein TM35_000651150 [Trypanosoma theileri]ORC83553.1 hypothetical protein TM35_000651150 [Trypanosoma theileri]